MLIEINDIEYCRLNIKYEADPEQVENKRSEVLNFFKDSQVPGFRAGKTPPEVLKFHFKDKIEDLTKSEMAQLAYQTAIAEKNIRPFGQPQFTSVSLSNNIFKCEFAVNKIPEIELKDYKGFELPKGNIPDATTMSEKILQELRVKNGDTLPFTEEDFIQQGDSAIIGYNGYLPNEEQPVISNDGEMFVVGQADIDAFNENILGMKVGDTREFIVLMPENSAAQHIAGKEVRYVVKLNMASKSSPHPLDDALAQKIGVKDLAELTSLTQGMASQRVQELQKQYLNDQLARRLIDKNPFEVPVWLTSFEAKMLCRQYGQDWDNLSDIDKTNMSTIAEKNVKLSIILDKIRENEPDAQMTDEEVFSTIKQNLPLFKRSIPSMSGLSDQEFLQQISQSGYLGALISTVKDDFTMDFIVKNSTVVE